MAKAVDATRVYNLDYHKKHRIPRSAQEFWTLSNRIEEYVKNKGWNLDRSNTSWYVSFKSGFPVVFGVSWAGSKSFCLFFKVPREVAERTKIDGFPLHKYQDSWSQALYKVESSDTDLDLFEPMFVAAYKYIVGE